MSRCDTHVLAYRPCEDWLEQCLESMQGAETHVHLIRGGAGGSIGRARAQAFPLGSAPYVCFVDDDDYVLAPEAFEAACDHLDANPHHVGVYTDITHISPAGDWTERKRAWSPLRQLTRCSEILHLHVMRRSAVELYLEELAAWPTWEEYVLLGLIAAHGDWHHMPCVAYAKRAKPAAESSMRLHSPELWRAAVRRVTPTLMTAHRRQK